MSTIEEELLVEGTKDQVTWAPLRSGIFSCRSFRMSIASERPISERWRK